MAVTIKGFASDWSVPGPAQAALDALYIRGGYIPNTPLRYGGVGDGVADDTSAVGNAIQETPTGGTLDLLGRTYRITTGMTFNKAITVRNGTLTAENTRVAITTAPDVRFENVQFIRTGTGRSGSTDSALTLNAANATLVDVTCKSTIGDALRMGNGTCNGTVIRGGHYETADPNDSVAIHWVSGAAHNHDVTISGATIRNTGYGTGVGLYNCSRTTVEHCDVQGVRRSPLFTASGWTLVSGTVYRTDDRTDTESNAVYVDGVEYRKNSPSDSTTPALNYYTVPGDGYLYINTGVDPATQTVTTSRTNGYGILYYCTSSETLGMSDNLVAHNYVEDVDGFGIYYQTERNVPKNNRTLQNTLRNVCLAGSTVADLPFAGIGVFGGADVQLDGDLIDGVGTASSPVPGVAFKATATTAHMTVTMSKVTVRNSEGAGVRIAPGSWKFTDCEIVDNAGDGITHGTIVSSDSLDANITGCTVSRNGANGVYFETTTTAEIRLTITGGKYANNTARNILLGRCRDIFIGGGLLTSDAGIEGIKILGNNIRVMLDGIKLRAGVGIDIAVGIADLTIGNVMHDGTSGTKVRYTGRYKVMGATGYGSESWVGPGTPEGSLAAPIGSTYRRTDGGAGTTFYVKETGTGNTGWGAK